jgi:hypothetical protein
MSVSAYVENIHVLERHRNEYTKMCCLINIITVHDLSVIFNKTNVKCARVDVYRVRRVHLLVSTS